MAALYTKVKNGLICFPCDLAAFLTDSQPTDPNLKTWSARACWIGTRASLNARLEAAATKVNQRNLKGAIGELQAFISEASAVLKPVDGESLITAAREIIAQFAAPRI